MPRSVSSLMPVGVVRIDGEDRASGGRIIHRHHEHLLAVGNRRTAVFPCPARRARRSSCSRVRTKRSAAPTPASGRVMRPVSHRALESSVFADAPAASCVTRAAASRLRTARELKAAALGSTVSEGCIGDHGKGEGRRDVCAARRVTGGSARRRRKRRYQQPLTATGPTRPGAAAPQARQTRERAIAAP